MNIDKKIFEGVLKALEKQTKINDKLIFNILDLKKRIEVLEKNSEKEKKNEKRNRIRSK